MCPVSMRLVRMPPVFMLRFKAGVTGMTVVKGAKNKEAMNAGTTGTMTVVAVAAGGTTGAMVIAEGHALGP